MTVDVSDRSGPARAGSAVRAASFAAVVFLWGTTGVAPADAQTIPPDERTFNEQVLRPDGQPVIPLFDGWFENDDGTRSLCFGYFNLNTEEALDIPVGPDNRIEPIRFDGDQPTHFDPNPEAGYRRHFCVFTVEVPDDFGRQRVRWSLTLDGETFTVPGHTEPPYVLDEPRSDGRGKVAPALRLRPDGPVRVGRRIDADDADATYRVGTGEPLTLTAWVRHPDDDVWVGWSEHRGPGAVRFSEAEQRATGGMDDGADASGASDPDGGWRGVTTEARFSEPGRYLIRVQTIDDPVESFEYHCCWTNGYVRVTVE